VSAVRNRNRVFMVAGLLVVLLLAGLVSNFASGAPDGLDSVARAGCTFDAEDNITGGSCLAQRAAANQTDDSPLADYGIRGLRNQYLSTGLAGVFGVLATLGVSAGLFQIVRRRRRVA
jgi:cobalt/nickel transport protein